MANLSFDADRFVIDSHRGAFKEGLLENSVLSFTQSYKEGANCVESDIRLTKDGQIALIHNKTIDHIAKSAIHVPEFDEFNEGPTGPVRKHSMAYLNALKFEHDAEILDFPNYLNMLNDLKIGAQIELKEFGFEDLILQQIEDANIDYESLLGPIVCTSFNYLAVKRLINKASKYNIPLYKYDGTAGLAFGFQAISTGAFYGKWALRGLAKSEIWGGMTHYRYMPIKQLEYAHSLGVKFCPRVPDEKELIYAYIEAGVDGFETDNVPLIRECCEEKGIELWPLPQ